MKHGSPTEPTSTVPIKGLAGKLPTVSALSARSCRVAFDRRAERWLGSLLELPPPLRAALGRAPANALVLSLACGEATLQLAVEASAWPALQMTASLPDRQLARDVAAAMLAPLIRGFASALPGLSLNDVVERAIPPGAYPSLACGTATVTLLRLDDRLAASLFDHFRQVVPMQTQHLRRLALPARLRLFQRELSSADLRSLGPGDVVLADAASFDAGFHITVVFGSGITMQAEAEIDVQSSRMMLTEQPQQIEEAFDGPSGARPDTAALGDLLVPVTFEIDSTRMSLDELASLDTGAVIELDMPLMASSVRLVCHGQTVGLGQLVAIGDRLGVRIRSMGATAGTAAAGRLPS